MSIKVEEIITQAMVLRLWLRTGQHLHKKNLHIVRLAHASNLQKRKWLHSMNKLPCIDRAIT
jgi:hypothetical protein